MADIRLDWDPCEQCDVETVLVHGPDLDEPATCARCGRDRGTQRQFNARVAQTFREAMEEGGLERLQRNTAIDEALLESLRGRKPH